MDYAVAIVDRRSYEVERGKIRSLVGEELAGLGYETYQPKYRTREVHRGRRLWIEHFLLGPYMLVRLVEDWGRQFVDVSSRLGVRSVMTTPESEPLRASAKEVDRLRDLEDHGYVATGGARKLRAGDRVLILRGLFATHQGTYTKPVGDDQDEITVSLLGKMTRLTVDRDDYAPI